MKKKIKLISIILGIILFLVLTCHVIYEIYDFMNDYRCSNLPINEFFQDEKCEKYWRYR